MKLIQITDFHVTPSFERARGDVDTRSNFLEIINILANEAYDLICLSGDLCYEEPQLSIYEWIYEEIKGRIDLSKLRVISGNHDDPQMVRNVFHPGEVINDGELYYGESIDDQLILYLDTTKGCSSETQKNWLRHQLAHASSSMIVVFMHHPPVKAGVRHMDMRYALKDDQEFQEIFHSFPDKTFQIFCGHYHVDRIISIKNMTVHITPSCYVQIDPEPEYFRADHYVIGYRTIEINKDICTSFVTYVRS